MRWFWEPKSEHRAADFGAALSQAYQDLAGAVQVDAAKTAAAEFSIGLMGRAFALAEVDGVNIPAPTLAAIGRNLGLRGNAVFDVLADPVGGLVMMPASVLGYSRRSRSGDLDLSPKPWRSQHQQRRNPNGQRRYPLPD